MTKCLYLLFTMGLTHEFDTANMNNPGLPYTMGLTHELDTANMNNPRCTFGSTRLAESLSIMMW